VKTNWSVGNSNKGGDWCSSAFSPEEWERLDSFSFFEGGSCEKFGSNDDAFASSAVKSYSFHHFVVDELLLAHSS
jgi:hypothetical protein